MSTTPEDQSMENQFQTFKRLDNYGNNGILSTPEGWIGTINVNAPFKGLPLDAHNLFRGFAVKLLSVDEIPLLKTTEGRKRAEQQLKDIVSEHYDDQKHQNLLKTATSVLIGDDRVHPVLSNGFVGLFKGVTRTTDGLKPLYAIVCQSGIESAASKFLDSLYVDPSNPQKGFKVKTWGEFVKHNNDLGNLKNFSNKLRESLIMEFAEALGVVDEKNPQAILPLTSNTITHDIYLDSNNRDVYVLSDALPVNRVRGGFLLTHSHPAHGLTYYAGDPQSGKFQATRTLDPLQQHDEVLCCSNGTGSLKVTSTRTPLKLSKIFSSMSASKVILVTESPLFSENFREPNNDLSLRYVKSHRDIQWGHADLRPIALAMKQ